MNMFVYTTIAKHCPLTLEERQVYSAIIFWNKVKGKTATANRIRNTIGKRTSTIRNCIMTLANYNLCSPDGATAFAPVDKTVSWFATRTTQNVKHWADSLAYTVMEFGESGLRAVPNAILSLLRSRDAQKQPLITSQNNLAKMLGVSQSAVSHAMTKLRREGLIHYEVKYREGKNGSMVPKGVEVRLLEQPQPEQLPTSEILVEIPPEPVKMWQSLISEDKVAEVQGWLEKYPELVTLLYQWHAENTDEDWEQTRSPKQHAWNQARHWIWQKREENEQQQRLEQLKQQRLEAPEDNGFFDKLKNM